MFWCDSPRDSILVSGADAEKYLQSQLSQDLRPMQPGDSAWSFVLAPTGKVESLVRVARRDDATFLLDTDAGHGDALIARLTRFRIRVAVDFVEVDRRIVAVRGGEPEAAPGHLVAWGSGVDVDLDAGGEVPSDAVAGTADDLEAARVAAGWPALGSEIEPGETVPAETGVVAVAVSFTKGCYPGQELVERMDSRGARAPFRLTVVDAADGAAVGDEVVVDGAVVGRLTSVAGGRAIARVRRDVA